MGIQLPDDAAGVNESPSVKEVKEEKSLFQKTAEFPGKVKKAFTGEDQPIEFPDLPEIGQLLDPTRNREIDDRPSFLEAIGPDLKMMLARDDLSKAEILNNSFEGDPRWGGAYQDKFGLPLIVWNNKAYYINKPGFSFTDFSTVVGELVKFFPATKLMQRQMTTPRMVGVGLPTYGATEGASQVIESKLAPETAKAKKKTAKEFRDEIALSAGIGTGMDVATRGIGKVIAPAIKGTAKKITPKIFPDFKEKSKYDLTKGQREAPLIDSSKGPVTTQTTPQLEKEDVARFSATTDPGARNIVKGFDENQLTAIKDDAKLLQEQFGSGKIQSVDGPKVPISSAEGIKNIVEQEANLARTISKNLYKNLQNLEKFTDGPKTIATREGVLEVTGNILDSIQVAGRELDLMPVLKNELQYLKRLNNMASNPNFRGFPFKTIQSYQKVINRISRNAAPGSPESVFLGDIKRQIDDAVFNGIEQGFIVGDPNVLKELKEATINYRTYIGLTGKEKGKDFLDKSANGILKKISNPDFTADHVANALFGHAKLNTPATMKLVLKKLKNNLSPEGFQQVNALLKDAILEKAFSGAGKSGVTRTNIVNNFNEIFVDNQVVAKEIFSPDEIKQIKQFKDNVLPTLWAEIKLNPSGTGYLMLGALENKGLLSFTKAVPFLGEGIVAGLQSVRASGEARNMVSQYIRRSSVPLFTNGPITISEATQSFVRPEITKEDSSVLDILGDIDDKTKEKIINLVQ